MRTEDHTSADILFGQLPESLASPQVPVSTVHAVKSTILLIIFGLSYVLISGFILLAVFFDTQSVNGWILPIFAVFGWLLITTWKSQVLLMRYGPDLAYKNSRKLSFIFTQMLVNHTLIVSVVIGIWYGLSSYNLLQLPFIILLCAIVFLIAYTRSALDIGLITAGFGMGLVPSWLSFQDVISRLKLFSQIKGEKAMYLLALKLALWVSLYVTFLTQNFVLIPIISLVFLFFFVHWERVNASSVLMQIRAKVQAMSPSILPIKELAHSSSLPVKKVQSSPKKPASEILYRKPRTTHIRPASFTDDFTQFSLSKNESEGKSSILNDTTMDLTPLAARSINRIAEKIKAESGGIVGSLPRNVRIYCSNCGTEGVSNPEMCNVCKSFTNNNSFSY